MIAAIKGILEGRTGESLLLRARDITFEVFVPSSLLSRPLEIGSEIRLYTTLLIHRHMGGPDIPCIYGFASPEERELFELLIQVPGIGPRTALSILSDFAPSELMRILASGETEILAKAGRVGKKKAARLISELREKLKEKVRSPSSSPDPDLIQALMNLGFSAREALSAASSVPHDPALSLEEKIKLALKHVKEMGEGYERAGR